ncbi:MAG: hypothetical protein WCL11_20475, partial [Verrucomicrobiota bacterium]
GEASPVPGVVHAGDSSVTAQVIGDLLLAEPLSRQNAGTPDGGRTLPFLYLFFTEISFYAGKGQVLGCGGN